jgi:hypothetical protein
MIKNTFFSAFVIAFLAIFVFLDSGCKKTNEPVIDVPIVLADVRDSLIGTFNVMSIRGNQSLSRDTFYETIIISYLSKSDSLHVSHDASGDYIGWSPKLLFGGNELGLLGVYALKDGQNTTYDSGSFINRDSFTYKNYGIYHVSYPNPYFYEWYGKRIK